MKRFLIVVTLLVVGISYVHTTYSVGDFVAYSHQKAHPKYSPLAEYYAGYYLQMKDRYQEAIPILEAHLEAYPESAWKGAVIFRLGECYEGIGQKAKAKELYQQYLADNPNGEHSKLAQRKVELIGAQ